VLILWPRIPRLRTLINSHHRILLFKRNKGNVFTILIVCNQATVIMSDHCNFVYFYWVIIFNKNSYFCKWNILRIQPITHSLTHSLERKMKIIRPQKENVWELYMASKTVRPVKWRMARGAEYVVIEGGRGPEMQREFGRLEVLRKRPLGQLRNRWVDIKFNLREACCKRSSAIWFCYQSSFQII
jgi:hypothetical protein